jgi:hypothetical protein
MTTPKTFFGFIIELMKLHQGYRKSSEDVRIAMGKYHLPSSYSEAVKKIRRQWQ